MSLSNLYPSISPSLSLDFAAVKKLDSRITFTRTTTATYYNGVTTAKAEENLFLQSQTFNTGWLTLNVSVTADNATAPDGTTTADTIVENAATGVHEIYSFATVNGVTYTISVFAKRNSGTRNLTFRGAGQGGAGVHPIFDLGSGTVAQNGTGTWSNQTIVSVGGGWYRCSATVVASAVANMFIGMADGTSQSYTGDDTSSIDLWGAQIEQRSAVSAYTPTTTQPITNYIPVLETAASGVARFDHNPTTGESLGLLVEEQRTNLFTYSEDFADAAWTKTRSSITANTIVAPDGTLTGDKLVENTDNNTHYATQSISYVAGLTYTCSVYVKAAERKFFEIVLLSTAFSGNVQAFFDLENGTAGTLDADALSQSITSVGNGWYRCSVTAVANATVAAGTHLRIANSINTDSYTGDGYSGIYIWGAQLEAGAFPTSYIATTSATVTRNADAASMTGTNFSSWFNNAEGAFYTEINPFVLGSSAGVVANNNTSDNRIRLTTASITDQARVSANATLQATLDGGTPVANTNMKLMLSYKVNDFALSLNGGAVATDTSGIVPVVNQLQIGAETTTVGNLHIKKLAYYPLRLSNAQLQALTA